MSDNNEIKKDETSLAEVLEETLPEELSKYMTGFNSAMDALSKSLNDLESKIEDLKSQKEDILKAQNEVEQVRASYSSNLIEINSKHNEGIESIKEAIKKCGDNEALTKAIEVEEKEKEIALLNAEKEINIELNNITKFLNIEEEKQINLSDINTSYKEPNLASEFNLDELLNLASTNKIEPDYNIDLLNSETDSKLKSESLEEEKFEELIDKTIVPNEAIGEILSSSTVMENVKNYLDNLSGRNA